MVGVAVGRGVTAGEPTTRPSIADVGQGTGAGDFGVRDTGDESSAGDGKPAPGSAMHGDCSMATNPHSHGFDVTMNLLRQ